MLESREIILQFNIFPPPTVEIGDILPFTATINPVTGDETEEDNIFSLDQIVVGTFDPNDIRCLQGDSIFIEEADGYLHYLIRFQNTGNASALRVVVENTLDNKFEWNTMQLLDLSHDANVQILNGNEVSFIFDAIYLSGSEMDEPNSHGLSLIK